MKPTNNNNNLPSSSSSSLSSASSFQLPKIPSHLIGESALIDKETGQVFWQGGKRDTQSLLSDSNNNDGSSSITTYHLKSSIITGLLIVSLLSFILSALRNYLSKYSTFHTNDNSSNPSLSSTISIWNKKIYYMIKICTILLYIIPIPKQLLHNPYYVSIIILFYFLEALYCNTNKYLNNSMDCYNFEKYMNDIEIEKPNVSWKVRCFHYDDTINTHGSIIRRKGAKNINSDGSSSINNDVNDVLLSSSSNSNNNNGNKWNRKKVITHEITKQYNYTRFEHKTIANIVSSSSFNNNNQQLLATTNNNNSNSTLMTTTNNTTKTLTNNSNNRNKKPFVKITLSKILLLSNKKTKLDYFNQQSSFVSIEGRKDTYAEYSTSIQVHNFKPKLLAIREQDENITNTKIMTKVIQSLLLKPYMFWICTCLGLSLPYRIIFHKYCDELRITLIKETFNDNDYYANNIASSSASSSSSNSNSNAWFINQKYNDLLQSISSSISTIMSNTNSSSSSSTDSTSSSRKDEHQEIFENFMRQYNLYPTVSTINNATTTDNAIDNVVLNTTSSLSDEITTTTAKQKIFLNELNAKTNNANEIKKVEALSSLSTSNNNVNISDHTTNNLTLNELLHNNNDNATNTIDAILDNKNNNGTMLLQNTTAAIAIATNEASSTNNAATALTSSSFAFLRNKLLPTSISGSATTAATAQNLNTTHSNDPIVNGTSKSSNNVV